MRSCRAALVFISPANGYAYSVLLLGIRRLIGEQVDLQSLHRVRERLEAIRRAIVALEFEDQSKLNHALSDEPISEREWTRRHHHVQTHARPQTT